ncbi:MAG: hypothetical protein U0270_14420 [Labilithrix sp.]
MGSPSVASASSVGKGAIDADALWPDLAAVEELSYSELETKLYPKPAPTCVRPQPDCAALHLELRRPGVTLALLHVFTARAPFSTGPAS